MEAEVSSDISTMKTIIIYFFPFCEEQKIWDTIKYTWYVDIMAIFNSQAHFDIN